MNNITTRTRSEILNTEKISYCKSFSNKSEDRNSIQNTLKTFFDKATTPDELAKLKSAAKLAIKIIQETVNHGGVGYFVDTNHYGEGVVRDGSEAKDLFDLLTNDGKKYLERVCVHTFGFGNTKLSFWGTNYTKSAINLREYIDNYQLNGMSTTTIKNAARNSTLTENSQNRGNFHNSRRENAIISNHITNVRTIGTIGKDDPSKKQNNVGLLSLSPPDFSALAQHLGSSFDNSSIGFQYIVKKDLKVKIWNMNISNLHSFNSAFLKNVEKLIIPQDVILSGRFGQILDAATAKNPPIALTLLLDTRTQNGRNLATVVHNGHTLMQIFNIIDLNPEVYEGLHKFNDIIRENRSYTSAQLGRYRGSIDDIIQGIMPDNRHPVVINEGHEVHNADIIYSKLAKHALNLPTLTDPKKIEKNWDNFCVFVKDEKFGVGTDSAKKLLSNLKTSASYQTILPQVKIAVANAVEYCNQVNNREEGRGLLSTYVINFLIDSANAYGNGGVSCTKGIIERAKFSLYNIYFIHTQDKKAKPYFDALKLFLAISNLPAGVSFRRLLEDEQEGQNFKDITKEIQKPFQDVDTCNILEKIIKNQIVKDLPEEIFRDCIKCIIKFLIPGITDDESVIELLVNSILSKRSLKEYIVDFLRYINNEIQ